MRKPSLGQLVYVKWTDCHSLDAWTSLADLRQTYDPTVETVGIFAGTNRSGSWVLVTGLLDEEIGACTWFVPSKMISRWRVLKAKKP